ncbi:hypothetical protein LMG27952_02277 [Paraburkholderia hiiakae]|uniref:Uncharacterized protein n=1 Tax=Paraburkholderia hiiakae TaxID=1081782 RepID=A0ABM8NK01_9BURK|nr:hypothetical protein [Paraburkholderia hiiakae]CAD6529240.1 hypothetical protein LMG27952_02277 [Paraburkholderia hiiakae]
MIDKPKHNRPGVAILFGLYAAGILTFAGCASSVPPRTAAVPKEHTGPISVDITAVPAGSTTLTILKDKQDCDAYSHFDARLFAQCMEKRGYAVAVYGPDHQRTTIEELYAPHPAPSVTAPAPVTAPAATAPAAQSVSVPPAPSDTTPPSVTTLPPMLTEQERSTLVSNMVGAALGALAECGPELIPTDEDKSAQDGKGKNVSRFMSCELGFALKQVGHDTGKLFCNSPRFDHALVVRLNMGLTVVKLHVSDDDLARVKPGACIILAH